MAKGLTYLLAGMASALASTVLAQTAGDNLKGSWVADSRFCEQAIVVVLEVEPTGIVRGSFTCKRTGWKPVMGDKIDRNSVKGTLSGNRFVMENADGGGFDVVLEGNSLKGTGQARAGAEKSSITYLKQ